jgi:pilus assembly protein Flp/PilA
LRLRPARHFPASPDAILTWRSIVKDQFLRFLRNDTGVSAIEYALLAGLIAVVIVVSIGTAGTQLIALFTFVKSQVVLATS